MRKPDELKLTLLTFLLVLTVFSSGLTVIAKTDIGVALDKRFTIDANDEVGFIDSRTKFTLKASLSNLSFESITIFEEGKESTEPLKQELNLNYDLQKLSTTSVGVFEPSKGKLDYLLQSGKLEKEPLTFSSVLLLEYIRENNEYGSGLEFELSGSTRKNVQVSGSFRFGMDKYLAEVYDPTVKGSGYYIITEGKVGPSEFPFGSALLKVSDIGLGPCLIANRTKFTGNDGFLFSGFSFDFIKNKEPWKTRGYLYFTDKETTMTLVPTINVDFGNLKLVADFGRKLEDENYTLSEIVFRGVKFNTSISNRIDISGTLVLDGKMKKEKGAKQMDLRAADYKLTRSFDEISRNYLFEQVEWTDVFSLELSPIQADRLSKSVALDLYFNQAEKVPVLELASVNGVIELVVNQKTTFRTGLTLIPDERLDKIVFDISYEF